MDDHKPLVTVNILSFNRKEELRNTLTKVYEQDYNNIEIIVVDNASSDGSPEMVKEEFPNVKLIRMGKNVGIAGWNEGFKAANGEYVLVLDDDSYPIFDTIRVGIARLIKNTNVAIIACNVVPSSDYGLQASNNLEELEKPVNNFVGCGAIIRKSVFSLLGGFKKELFLYFHEVEYSIRVVDAGWEIIYCPTSVIIHNLAFSNRQYDKNWIDNRKVYYDIRNLLFIIYLHFSFSKSWPLFFRILLGRITFGILNKKLLLVLSAIRSTINCIINTKPKRDLISKSTQKRYLYGSFAGGFFFFNNYYGLKRPKWLKHN